MAETSCVEEVAVSCVGFIWVLSIIILLIGQLPLDNIQLEKIELTMVDELNFEWN